MPEGLARKWRSTNSASGVSLSISDPTAVTGELENFVEPADYSKFLLVSGNYVMWECIGTRGCVAQVSFCL